MARFAVLSTIILLATDACTLVPVAAYSSPTAQPVYATTASQPVYAPSASQPASSPTPTRAVYTPTPSATRAHTPAATRTADAADDDDAAALAAYHRAFVVWINPRDIHLSLDGGTRKGLHLHFDPLVRGDYPSEKVTVNLVGTGAPSEPSYPEGREQQEGIDASDLVPGPYRLEVRAGASVLSSTAFNIIRTAAPGRQTELAVEPADRVNGVFLHHGLIEIAVPVDPRKDRKVSLAWAKNGKVKVTASGYVNATPLGLDKGAGELFGVRTWSNRQVPYYEPGHHELAIAVDGKLAGSWSWDVLGDDCAANNRSFKGLDKTFPGKFGQICGPELSALPHADADVTKAIQAALAENANRETGSSAGHEYYTEQMVCAVADDPKLNAKLVQIHAGHDELSRAGVTSAQAYGVLDDRYATHDAREDAKKTISAVNGNLAQGRAILKQMHDELARSASKYPKGCLAKILPPAVMPH
jgi:hypothetical protein